MQIGNVVRASQKQKLGTNEEELDALLNELEGWSNLSGIDRDRLLRLLMDGQEPSAQLFGGASLRD